MLPVRFAAFLVSVVVAGRVQARDTIIILDQPHDYQSGRASELGTEVPEARTADDFVTPHQYPQDGMFRFTAYMIVSYPNSPGNYWMELYADDGGRPAEAPLFVRDWVSWSADLGAWNGQSDLHLLRIEWMVHHGVLERDTRYWFVPLGIGNGQFNDRAWWGTSGDGVINGFEGQFKSDFFGYPDWTPTGSDFAFRVEVGYILPAPGPLALFAAAALIPRPRRRRR
jgi:hypothetical protein